MLGDKRKTVRLLRGLIRTFEGQLPPTTTNDVVDMLEHGEFGEALDILATQLYEHSVPIPDGALDDIHELKRLMEIAPEQWFFLHELRKSR